MQSTNDVYLQLSHTSFTKHVVCDLLTCLVAVVVDDKIEIRPMMYLALSYDHRMIDGKEAVQFLVTIKDLLEDPTRLILEI